MPNNNNDPLNLGDPSKDTWARMVAPKRDVTGAHVDEDEHRGKKKFCPTGSVAGFIYPMAVRGDGSYRPLDPGFQPKALYPPRDGYMRSSDNFGSWYYTRHARPVNVTARKCSIPSFAERFAKISEPGTWQQKLMSAEIIPRRWGGGPIITPV